MKEPGGCMGTRQSSDYGFKDHDGEAGWGSEFRLTDPFLKDFLKMTEKWTSSMRGPDEQKIDLLDAVQFLPHVFWFTLQEDDAWMCRFFGSEMVSVRGDDPTNRLLEKAEENLVDRYVAAFFDLVVEAGQPVSSTSQSVVEGREYLRTQSVGLPVFGPAATITGVIGAQAFYGPEE